MAVSAKSIFSLQETPYLNHIYTGKKGSVPRFTVVAPKTNGSSIGSIFQKNKQNLPTSYESSLWMGKVGAVNSLLTPQEGSSPITYLKEINLSVIAEKIGADCYHFLSQNRFIVPKTRLVTEPILDQFTQTDPKAVALVALLKGGPFESPLSSLRVMSKFVPGYINFEQGYTLDPENQPCLIYDYIKKYKRPPIELLDPQSRRIPLKGMIPLLAVGRALADPDLLGWSLTNAGFIWIKDSTGEIVEAKAVKIDSQLIASFKKDEAKNNFCNWVLNTIEGVKEGSIVKNLRDIQLSSGNEEIIIAWEALSNEQREEFLKTLFETLSSLENQDLLFYLLYREGKFYRNSFEHLPYEIAKEYQRLFLKWFDQQREIYQDKPPQIFFGLHSFIVDNSSFSHQGLKPKERSSFVEIDKQTLSTIGYTLEGFTTSLAPLQKEGRLEHLHFSNEHVYLSYEPYVDLTQDVDEKRVASELGRAIEDIASRDRFKKSSSYGAVALSFSKKYAFQGTIHTYIAHASPLIIAFVRGRPVCLTFDVVTRSLREKIVEASPNILIDSIEELLASPAHCSVFTLEILTYFFRNKEGATHILDRVFLRENTKEIPLTLSEIPSSFICLCDSIRKKQEYMSKFSQPALQQPLFDLRDLLKTPFMEADLIKVEGQQVSFYKKPISAFFYLRNIQMAKNLEHSQKILDLLDKEFGMISSVIHPLDALSSKSIRHITEQVFAPVRGSISLVDLTIEGTSILTETPEKDFVPIGGAYALDKKNQLVSLIDYIKLEQGPPLEILDLESISVPLVGFLSLMALCRLLGLYDILEDPSVGFIWIRDKDDKIRGAKIGALSSKMQPQAESYHYDPLIQRSTNNWVINTKYRLGSSAFHMEDLRDLQLSKYDRELRISWKVLSESQKTEFLEALRLASTHLGKVEKRDSTLTHWIKSQKEIYIGKG